MLRAVSVGFVISSLYSVSLCGSLILSAIVTFNSSNCSYEALLNFLLIYSYNLMEIVFQMQGYNGNLNMFAVLFPAVKTFFVECPSIQPYTCF